MQKGGKIDMRRLGILTTIVGAAAAVAVGFVGAASLPDVKRYLSMRQM